MTQTAAERQRAYKARQAAQGRTPKTFLLTEREAFFIERLIEEMRETGGTPAMMRDQKGRLYHLDT